MKTRHFAIASSLVALLVGAWWWLNSGAQPQLKSPSKVLAQNDQLPASQEMSPKLGGDDPKEGTAMTAPLDKEGLDKLDNRVRGLERMFSTYYAELFDLVGVTGEEKDKLLDLMVARQLLIDKGREATDGLMVRLNVNMPGGGQTGTQFAVQGDEAFWHSVEAASAKPMDSAILNLLGDDRFAKFGTAYIRISYYKSVTDALQHDLPPDEQLSKTAIDALLDLIAGANPVTGPVSTLYLTDAVVSQARTFLDPAQQDALLKVAENERTMQRWVQAGRALWVARGSKDKEVTIDAGD
jgi:hypothetical protein